MSKKNIYTVDDYPFAAYTVKRTIETLSQNDCIVSDFESPLTLLENFREEYKNIDMVITDYEMPEFCGDELITMLREIKPDIMIVVVSAWLDSTDSNHNLIKKEVQALNPDLILSKPFPANWVTELDTILDKVI